MLNVIHHMLVLRLLMFLAFVAIINLSIVSHNTTQSGIDKTVRNWAQDSKKAGRMLSFPELLRDLVFVLPADLLLLLYDSPHKATLDVLQTFTVGSNPAEVQM